MGQVWCGQVLKSVLDELWLHQPPADKLISHSMALCRAKFCLGITVTESRGDRPRYGSTIDDGDQAGTDDEQEIDGAEDGLEQEAEEELGGPSDGQGTMAGLLRPKRREDRMQAGLLRVAVSFWQTKAGDVVHGCDSNSSHGHQCNHPCCFGGGQVLAGDKVAHT